jgi:hypothetical protein
MLGRSDSTLQLHKYYWQPCKIKSIILEQMCSSKKPCNTCSLKNWTFPSVKHLICLVAAVGMLESNLLGFGMIVSTVSNNKSCRHYSSQVFPSSPTSCQQHVWFRINCRFMQISSCPVSVSWFPFNPKAVLWFFGYCVVNDCLPWLFHVLGRSPLKLGLPPSAGVWWMGLLFAPGSGGSATESRRRRRTGR